MQIGFLARTWWSNYAANISKQWSQPCLMHSCLKSWVRLLHLAEKDNLSPFDSNIACLCQSIGNDNNKQVYRQSLVWKPTGSRVGWAECSMILGTGCWVQVVFIAWSSIAQSVCRRAFSLLAILHSAEEDNWSPFDSNIACLCQSIEINNNKHASYILFTTRVTSLQLLDSQYSAEIC